jgi:hypothetical protein
MSERFVAKFSWSRPAALRLAREIGVLTALVRVPPVPLLPGVVASSTRPPLLITRRVPGSLCSRSSTRSTGSYRQTARVLLGGTAPVDSRERAEAAVGKLTGTQCRRPRPNTLRDRFGSWVRPDQRRALRAGASGRRRAGLCPPKPLRPLPGQQAAALAALQHGPHVLARTRRQPCIAAAIRASACSRQCDPARLGNAVSLTRRCLHLRPTADQGTARVNGQGNRPGM